MKKQIYGLLMIILIMMMTACSSPEDNIYQIIEETAVKEVDFEKQQEPMKELEIKEKELFDQIMELGMKELDEIQQLADDALANLDEREKLLTKEQEAINQSKEEFEKASTEISKIKDDKLKNEALELDKLMKTRFNAYESLNEAYLNGLAEDRKIYDMVKKEDLKLEDLEKQIEASNKAYEAVLISNEEFNEATEKFNAAKLDFYKAAGFKISTSNEE
ncbi:YkyA family protein [Bacillus niameyensis]|uniref:YkyA family protein n=1 Tax=Bacillus niameyensis TaxID=1522308 RepID=UPI00078116FD|nr:YkyA family protein [Bacillus niameyensis]